MSGVQDTQAQPSSINLVHKCIHAIGQYTKSEERKRRESNWNSLSLLIHRHATWLLQHHV